ncbi:MAG: RsmF rRNA methyltransferase first C-terminal domain-containing protein [Clostridia bacterium]|nr:RsmF rRNA methyltransferase first C-terminal domain-containing protein [Clostridia bacterium]
MMPLPTEFMEMIAKMLGEEAPAFFASLEEKPTLALRVNPLRKHAREAAAPFIAGGVPWEENGYYIAAGTRPGAGIAHAAGAFYLQEASAMVSVAALQPVPGERILDLCAAPGGKTTQIAAALAGEGLLVSNEPEPGRAKVLAANLERMGVQNAIAVNAYPDALAKRWSGYFDAILCDAPCSGEGMFRREPDSRLEWKPGAPAGCAKRQAEILDRAAELLRPGGRLVYSTCTFNPSENEDTISAFLARRPDFAAEDFELPGLGASTNGCMRIWPHRVAGDGHFCARLRKSGDERLPAPDFRNDKADLQLIRQLEGEVCPLPGSFQRFARMGDYLYALPSECPDVKGLKLTRQGVCLLRIGKNYIEPQHALAMAIDPSAALRKIALDDAQAAKYLAGETLNFDCDKGWTLVCWQNMALGWGKASNGQVKNHLPKGLRLSLHL